MLIQSWQKGLWITWLHWFASDVVGIITVAPLVIGLAEAVREPPPRNEILEGIAALVALGVMTVIIVSLPPKPWQTMIPVALLFPILLWVAAHCRPGFAAAAAFIVSLTIVWTITFGLGHFGDPAVSIDDRIMGARAAILGVSLCAYVLAALFAERRQHTAVVEESAARLHEALMEQSMHLALITRNSGAGPWISRITSTSASRGCLPSVLPSGLRSHELAIAHDLTGIAIVVVQRVACTTHRRKLLRMCRGALHPGCPGSGPSRRTFQFTVPAMKPAMISSQLSSEIGSGSVRRSGGRGCGWAGRGCGATGWEGTRLRANAASTDSLVGATSAVVGLIPAFPFEGTAGCSSGAAGAFSGAAGS
jgi:hypothetical protein